MQDVRVLLQKTGETDGQPCLLAWHLFLCVHGYLWGRGTGGTMPGPRQGDTWWAVCMALGRGQAGLILPPHCPGQRWVRLGGSTPGAEAPGLLLLWVALCTEATHSRVHLGPADSGLLAGAGPEVSRVSWVWLAHSWAMCPSPHA